MSDHSDFFNALLSVFDDFLEPFGGFLDAISHVFLLLNEAVVGAFGEEHYLELHGVHDVFHLLLLLEETVGEPVRVGRVFVEANLEEISHFEIVGFFQGLQQVLVILHGGLNHFSHSWIHLINIFLA